MSIARDKALVFLALTDPTKNEDKEERKLAAIGLARVIRDNKLEITDSIPVFDHLCEAIRSTKMAPVQWNKVRNNHACRCAVCNTWILVGELCAYSKDLPVTHIRCAGKQKWEIAVSSWDLDE